VTPIFDGVPPTKLVTVNRDALRSIRELSGLNLSQLLVACEGEISLSYLSDIEAGKRTQVSPGKVAVIARALKVPVAALILRASDVEVVRASDAEVVAA
jgi:transcriptional regulator with XRE-family HTH domain